MPSSDLQIETKTFLSLCTSVFEPKSELLDYSLRQRIRNSNRSYLVITNYTQFKKKKKKHDK